MDTYVLAFDADKTLNPEYMQKPLFDYFGLSDDEWNGFWQEKDDNKKKLLNNGLIVDGNILWLNKIIDYANNDVFPGLSNNLLMELGREIKFFPGIPEFFDNLKKETGADIEYYVITSGLRKMLQGSVINDYVNEIYGCELLERDGVVSEVGFSVDYTNKTRFLFAITKGGLEIVNDRVNDKRVRWHNMIYIGDGPSDIPCFEIVKNKGGKSIAVYDPDYEESLINAKKLMNDKRVDDYFKADYRPKSGLYNYLKKLVSSLISDPD
ncbi:hypothetical protein GF352_02940 [archaeon]|nr:hypothetical protein [archaeon]